MNRAALQHDVTASDAISYAGYRGPPDVISHAWRLYYRFPLSLRMVEELLAARGIELTYETVRRWSVKFGLGIAPGASALPRCPEATSGISTKW
jgi:putative transposase